MILAHDNPSALSLEPQSRSIHQESRFHWQINRLKSTPDWVDSIFLLMVALSFRRTHYNGVVIKLPSNLFSY